MRKFISISILVFIIQFPLVAFAINNDAYIPLFAITAQGNMQSVYNISNICNDGQAKTVNITFIKNDGTPLAEHPIRVNLGGPDEEVYNYGTCTSDCVSPTNSYTNTDGTVNVVLKPNHQMVLTLLGNSTPYLTGWGKISESTGSCLLANGLIRNGGTNTTPYFRAVQISEKPF